MLARIVNDKFIYIEQISTNEELILDKEFSVRHPRAQYLDTSNGFFDGTFHKYNRKHRRLARPFLSDLIRVCGERGLPLNVIDDRPPPKYPSPNPSVVTKDLLSGVELYDYQIGGIKSTCHNEVGCISAKTGAGKSEMIAGIAKIMNCPTIILCDMTIIVGQLKERLELRKTAEEVGMFYAGKRPNGQQIIVGSFQSLTIPSEPEKKPKDTPESYAKKLKAYSTRRKNARKLRDIIGKCDLLLVDECDQATSKQWRNLFWGWFKGRRRFGFTGTPNDPGKPVQNLVLKEHLGSVIYHVDRKEVEKVHRIVPVRYAAIAFGDEAMAKDRAAYDIALKEQIIENPLFHGLVKDVAALSIKGDTRYGTVVLVESIPLGNVLESIIPDSKFIYGNTPMKERMAAIRAFEDRKLRVLIGGKIIRRGLDLKGGCESLIIATGGKLASDFDQKIGRAVRVNCRGFAKIYDFYFLGNFYLYTHSRLRLKTIVSMGYPAKVIFRNGVVEADKFIKSRFRRPKTK